jgi:hypothetical protein
LQARTGRMVAAYARRLSLIASAVSAIGEGRNPSSFDEKWAGLVQD